MSSDSNDKSSKDTVLRATGYNPYARQQVLKEDPEPTPEGREVLAPDSQLSSTLAELPQNSGGTL